MSQLLKFRKRSKLPVVKRNEVVLFVDQDGTLKTRDEDGNVSVVGAGGGGGSLPDPITDPVNIAATDTENYSLFVVAPENMNSQIVELQNFGGDELFSVDANGTLVARGQSQLGGGSTQDPGFPPLTVTGTSGQTAPLMRFINQSAGFVLDVLVGGQVVLKAHAAPADGDLSAGDCALWFDQTNGAAKLMVKAKSANGTVVTGEVALAP